MTDDDWASLRATLIEHAEETINADPRVLLEVDGGPAGQTADVVLARLYGFDEQVDHDWRIRRVERELFTPISVRMTSLGVDSMGALTLPRTARYVLQSNFARFSLDARYAPPDVRVGPPTFQVSVLFVRYKRRV